MGREGCINLANTLNSALSKHSQIGRFWLRLPFMCGSQNDPEDEKEPEDESWKAWSLIRGFCNDHQKLFVALELETELPSQNLQERWLSENLGAVFLPTSVFQTSRDGELQIPAAHSEFLFHIFDRHPHAYFIISGMPAPDFNWSDYQECLRKLVRRQPQLSETEAFEKPFRDMLQSPLQPLASNLASSTYEVFELDPVKYTCYTQAIYRALLDRFAPSKLREKGLDTSKRPTAVIMVVGAGRGPLVKASLRASAKSGIPVRVYAVEKNPNAVVTLRAAVREDWGSDRVKVVSQDMRTWDAPEMADLIVSELLGSFGDNELSPECLDGVQRFLKEDGACIPDESTSYLAPISTSRLWSQLHSQAMYSRSIDPLEQCYVVKLSRFHRIAAPQPCFRFQHPNFPGARLEQPDAALAPQDTPKARGLEDMSSLPPEYEALEREAKQAWPEETTLEPEAEAEEEPPASVVVPRSRDPSLECRLDNTRFRTLGWTVAEDAVLHGFAGYFDCRLYDDIYLSINPENFSEGMFSWFPVYFPLKNPVEVRKGDALTVHFWRKTDGNQVWYEWALSSPQVSSIHNPQGRSASIGLQV